MLNVFDVGMTIHLVDKASAGLGGLITSLNRGQTAAAALQTKMQGIHSLFTSGVLMIGGGMALAAPLIHAESAAEHLEESMKRLQISTRANAEEMTAFSRQFSDVSNLTGIFSKPKLADFAYAMRESGLDKDQIKNLLPLYAKGADVLSLLSHGKINADQSAHGFSSLAHQFGKYSADPKAADSMQPIIEAAMRLAPQLPGGLNTLVRGGSYLNIIGNRTMGIDPVKLMALQATVSQTSGGTGTGRGALSAANIANALQRSMPGVFGGGLLEGKSAFSAQVLGLADSKGFATTMTKDAKTGKSVADLGLIMNKFLTAFQTTETAAGRMQFAEKMHANLDYLTKTQRANLEPMVNAIIASHGEKGTQAQLLTTMFSNLGGSAKTLFTLFADPKFQKQYQQNLGLATTGKSIDQTQQDLSQTTYFQRVRSATNMETLMSTIGIQLLPVFKNMAMGMGDLLYKMNDFAEKHPRIVQAGVALVALASGALILGGIVSVAAAGISGLALIAGGLVGGISAFVASFSAIGATIAGIAGLGGMLIPVLAAGVPLLASIGIAIGAVILVIRNWQGVLNFAKTAVDYMKIALAGLIVAGQGAAQMFSGLAKVIGGALNSIGGMVNGLLSSIHLPTLPQMSFPDFSKPDKNVLAAADKTINDFGSNLIGKKNSLPPPPMFMPPPIPTRQLAMAQAPTHVTINQTNTHNIQTQPHHDTKHIVKEVQRIQTLNNHHLTKAITSGQGSLRSNFTSGDSRGNE